jgi:Penicillin amidase
MLRGYLAGLNMHFANTPSDQLDPACRAYARALTDTDLYRVITDRLTRAGSVAFLAQLAGFERLYEARLTVPGQLDTSGVTMLGVPVVVLGYNKDVAWTHTVSTARRFTLHELALKPGDVSVPLADGSTSTRRYYRTELGPLIQLPHPLIGLTWTATRAYAFQHVNLDNNRAVATWLAAGKARDVRELRDAMGTLRGAPYVNTIASDRNGEVLFGDLPRRSLVLLISEFDEFLAP